MKFPLRLSLDLLSSRITRALDGGRDNATIFHLFPPAFSSTNQEEIDAESDPNAAVMEIPANIASQTTAPIFWVGGAAEGDEPLLHPVIGRIAGALNKTGRNVFLHTNGLRLRKRMHEFRPDPRLFLTVELAGRAEVHDQALARPGCFVRVMEGIRAAKLSGFHVCAHVTVNSQTDVCETGELFEYLDNYDVDGFIVSSGGEPVEPATRNELQEKLREIRALVRCSRWEYFSSLLEDSYAAPRAGKAPVPAPQSDASACKETA
jgi:sulfatase maturation enzyme AslB (radical SAM superfamily)